jgi:hypothetical protein
VTTTAHHMPLSIESVRLLNPRQDGQGRHGINCTTAYDRFAMPKTMGLIVTRQGQTYHERDVARLSREWDWSSTKWHPRLKCGDTERADSVAAWYRPSCPRTQRQTWQSEGDHAPTANQQSVSNFQVPRPRPPRVVGTS